MFSKILKVGIFFYDKSLYLYSKTSWNRIIYFESRSFFTTNPCTLYSKTSLRKKLQHQLETKLEREKKCRLLLHNDRWLLQSYSY